MDIKETILNLIQKKYTLEEGIDVDSFNYIESGFVDSMGLIMFVVELEEQYGIRFTDDEMIDEKFQTVGGLVTIIEEKLANK